MLDTHRHHNITESFFRFRHGDEYATRRGREVKAHRIVFQEAEYFEQVGNVETDIQFIMRLRHVYSFQGFFMFRVRTLNLKLIVGNNPTYAMEFFIGHDRNTT